MTSVSRSKGIAARTSKMPQATPPMKRRRVELACTNCRQKKSRCDGQHPTCLNCLRGQLVCDYQEISQQSQLPHGRNPSSDSNRVEQLIKRVKELEQELASMSHSSTYQHIPQVGTIVDCEDALSEAASNCSHLPRQKFPMTGEEASLTVSDEEATIDTLATVAFSQGFETEMGHFGPTSNHDYFQALSSIFAHLARDGISRQPQNLHGWSKPHGGIPVETSQRATTLSDTIDLWSLPDDQTAMALFNQFFATMSLTLPYVSRPSILRDYTHWKGDKFRRLPKLHRALYNIIWAHGSSSLDKEDAEVFYRRAVTMLDSLTIRGTSQEMVQLLLLISSFQQNHQRAVASWTFHALGVKAAFQLGLQSPRSYENLSSEKQQLMKRLWFGVLTQDTILCASLGRPCLIPKQHACIDLPQDPRPVPTYLDAISPDRIESLTFFNHIISICSIVATTVEDMYNHNITTSSSSIDDYIVRRVKLTLQLERWREGMSKNWRVLSASELQERPLSEYEKLRFQIIISIHYYRTVLLINRPVITKVLREWVFGSENILESVGSTIGSVFHDDFVAAKELVGIIQAVQGHGRPLLQRYAFWWLANYSVFTACIHLFGHLLASFQRPTQLSTLGILSGDVRRLLDDGLRTLQSVGRKSLMSQKGSTCFLKFLEVFDSLVSVQAAMTHFGDGIDLTNTLDLQGSADFAMGSMSSYIMQTADDFLFQGNPSEHFYDYHGAMSQ